MTAVDTEAPRSQASQNIGRVARVIGPIVDIEFPPDGIPEMYNALTTTLSLSAMAPNSWGPATRKPR